MEQEKKKIPKWLIVIIVLFIIGFFASLGSETDNETKLKSKTEVTIVNFSNMTIEEITNWCEENNLNCYKKEEYSDVIPVGNFISQSVENNKNVYEGSRIDIVYSLGKEPTASQKNALKSAKSYLNSSSFSYQGLIRQLEYEEYSRDDAIYAVDNCGADWMEQAYKSGKSYLRSSSFSLNSLIRQLEYEKFTTEQARYGAEKAYNEQ